MECSNENDNFLQLSPNSANSQTAVHSAGLNLSKTEGAGVFSDRYLQERDQCVKTFETWTESDQIDFVDLLLSKICHSQLDPLYQPIWPREKSILIRKVHMYVRELQTVHVLALVEPQPCHYLNH